MTAERAVRLYQNDVLGEWFGRCLGKSPDYPCENNLDPHFLAIPLTPKTRAVIEEAKKQVEMMAGYDSSRSDNLTSKFRALLSLLETEEEK